MNSFRVAQSRMSSEESSEDEDRRGSYRRSSRTPGLRESYSESESEDEDVRNSDESDKAEGSEEDRGTKVSLVVTLVSVDDNLLVQDTYGPQLSNKELTEELKFAKRLDNVDPNMELNPVFFLIFY